MKKNIILVLSLLLSSVSVCNLTSCQNDDDDDVDNSTRYEQVEESSQTYFLGSRMVIGIGEEVEDDDTNKEIAATSAFVQNYLEDNLKGLADSIEISEHFDHLCIHANKSNAVAIETKLKAMDADKSAFDTQLHQELPGIHILIFSIANDDFQKLYSYSYIMNKK